MSRSWIESRGNLGVSTVNGTWGSPVAKYDPSSGSWLCFGGDYQDQMELIKKTKAVGFGRYYSTEIWPELGGYDVEGGDRINDPAAIKKQMIAFKKRRLDKLGFFLNHGKLVPEEMINRGGPIADIAAYADLWGKMSTEELCFFAEFFMPILPFPDRRIIARHVDSDWGERFRAEFEEFKSPGQIPPELDRYITPFAVALSRYLKGEKFPNSDYFAHINRFFSEFYFTGYEFWDWNIVALRSQSKVVKSPFRY